MRSFDDAWVDECGTYSQAIRPLIIMRDARKLKKEAESPEKKVTATTTDGISV